jgi:alcohol dehydrogenase
MAMQPETAAATYRAPTALGRAAGLLSPGAAAAGRVALSRDRRQRLHRLAAVAGDAWQQRRHPLRRRMQSLIVSHRGRVSWQDTAIPPLPGPAGAVVSPVAMATCDLDRPLALGSAPFPLPLHLGHECVAEVLTVGESVARVAPGDRVVVPFQISCGECAACRESLTGNCRTVPPISMYGFGVAGGAWGGAFSEQLAVPYADAMLVPLPAGVDPAAVASAGDTLSDAYRHIAPNLDLVRHHPDGPRIIILGAIDQRSQFSGSVPLYAGQIAQALIPEASTVIFDARPWLREHAVRLGVEAYPPKKLRGLTAPLVIDCSAHPRGLALALRSTSTDGLCSCAGSLHARSAIPSALMFGRNATLSVARSHVRTAIAAVLELVVAGSIHPEAVTTTVAAFPDAASVVSNHLTSPDTKTILVRAT